MNRDDRPDQMVLGQVSTQARLFGRAVDRLAVERRLDEVARGALPGALGAALGRELGGHEGVVRIDTIDVAFAIDRRALDGGELAARWAARLGTAIAGRLRRADGAGVARFASYGHFVAAYLEHRFAVALHPRFAFADFAALEHLTPADAAIELLGARPAYLAELARQGRRHGRPAWLAERLDDARVEALLERIFASMQPTAPGAAAFRTLMADAPAAWRLHAPARAALALALSRLAVADSTDGEAVPATLALARLVTALDLLAREQPAALADIVAGKADAIAGLGGASAALRREQAFLGLVLDDSDWRKLAATVAEALAPAPPHAENEAGEHTPAGKKARTPAPPVLHSPFAGVALTLPVLRSLGLADQLHPDQFRALVMIMIAPDEATQDAAEALAAFLIPSHDPQPAPPWPAVPDDDAAEPSAESWAVFVLQSFAARLSGLQGSTPAYLRRQFLHGPGDLVMEEKALVVRLVRPALAIVLTMAGMVGDQGALPWLGSRRLRIELT
jgi:hypothetical protein